MNPLIRVSLLPLRDGKRQRCSLCNQIRPISRLALFHEGGVVCGDLLLCPACADVLQAALLQEVTIEEMEVSRP